MTGINGATDPELLAVLADLAERQGQASGPLRSEGANAERVNRWAHEPAGDRIGRAVAGGAAGGALAGTGGFHLAKALNPAEGFFAGRSLPYRLVQGGLGLGALATGLGMIGSTVARADDGAEAKGGGAVPDAAVAADMAERGARAPKMLAPLSNFDDAGHYNGPRMYPDGQEPHTLLRDLAVGGKSAILSALDPGGVSSGIAGMVGGDGVRDAIRAERDEVPDMAAVGGLVGGSAGIKALGAGAKALANSPKVLASGAAAAGMAPTEARGGEAAPAAAPDKRELFDKIVDLVKSAGTSAAEGIGSLMGGDKFDPGTRDAYRAKNMPPRRSEVDFINEQIRNMEGSDSYKAELAKGGTGPKTAKLRAEAEARGRNLFASYDPASDLAEVDAKYDAHKTEMDNRREAERSKTFAQRNPGVAAAGMIVPALMAAAKYRGFVNSRTDAAAELESRIASAASPSAAAGLRAEQRALNIPEKMGDSIAEKVPYALAGAAGAGVAKGAGDIVDIVGPDGGAKDKVRDQYTTLPGLARTGADFIVRGALPAAMMAAAPLYSRSPGAADLAKVRTAGGSVDEAQKMQETAAKMRAIDLADAESKANQVRLLKAAKKLEKSAHAAVQPEPQKMISGPASGWQGSPPLHAGGNAPPQIGTGGQSPPPSAGGAQSGAVNTPSGNRQTQPTRSSANRQAGQGSSSGASYGKDHHDAARVVLEDVLHGGERSINPEALRPLLLDRFAKDGLGAPGKADLTKRINSSRDALDETIKALDALGVDVTADKIKHILPLISGRSGQLAVPLAAGAGGVNMFSGGER